MLSERFKVALKQPLLGQIFQQTQDINLVRLAERLLILFVDRGRYFSINQLLEQYAMCEISHDQLKNELNGWQKTTSYNPDNYMSPDLEHLCIQALDQSMPHDLIYAIESHILSFDLSSEYDDIALAAWEERSQVEKEYISKLSLWLNPMDEHTPGLVLAELYQSVPQLTDTTSTSSVDLL